jgi:hypothetical protein
MSWSKRHLFDFGKVIFTGLTHQRKPSNMGVIATLTDSGSNVGDRFPGEEHPHTTNLQAIRKMSKNK